MLTILNLFLEIINFVRNAVHYVLVVSYLIGKGMFVLGNEIFSYGCVVLQGIAVVFEELWLFLRELHMSLNEMFTYIERSTNQGVAGVIEGFARFANEMRRFFTNSKLHSKLLASSVGRWIANFIGIMQGGLLLIADSVWFVVTIIPKTLFEMMIVLGDVIAFGIGGTWKLILRFAQNVIDELFRYTIAIAVIAIAFRNRRRIYRNVRLWTVGIVRTTLNWILKIYRFLFVLQPPRPSPQQNRQQIVVKPRSPINNINNSVLNKSNESNCCVVCRDRPKCVLLLPCKHLCMCEECAEFIATTRHAFCPLCRSTVHKQLSVYV